VNLNLTTRLRYSYVYRMANLTNAMVFIMSKPVPVGNALGGKRTNGDENEEKKGPASSLPYHRTPNKSNSGAHRRQDAFCLTSQLPITRVTGDSDCTPIKAGEV
jgi:hypothetical protein